MRAVILLFAFPFAAHAQTPPLRFEVASVKPNRTAECRGRWDFSAAHATVTAENAPLVRIISRAFNLTDDRVSGPAWLDSQCYDIRAKASGSVPDRDLMAMLQTLLAERFHLVARLVQEERPVFALVPDSGGSKLRGEKDDVPVPSLDGGKVLFMAKHLSDLCERLGKVAGRPVLDQTGLDGTYWIVLAYLPAGAAGGEPSDIFTALRAQLGLRLEPRRAPVEVLRIDRVDQVPTRN